MICDLLALRPISHITKKTLSYLHSTKIEQMAKTMVIFKRGAIFLCCIRCDPTPPQTSVQRLAHTRNVTTCCCERIIQKTPRIWAGGNSTRLFTNPLTAWPLAFKASLPKQMHSCAKSRRLRRLAMSLIAIN